jgi:hypothetical protein
VIGNLWNILHSFASGREELQVDSEIARNAVESAKKIIFWSSLLENHFNFMLITNCLQQALTSIIGITPHHKKKEMIINFTTYIKSTEYHQLWENVSQLCVCTNSKILAYAVTTSFFKLCLQHYSDSTLSKHVPSINVLDDDEEGALKYIEAYIIYKLLKNDQSITNSKQQLL